MKTNPLFYNRSNANKLKIGFAKRKLVLSLACIFSIAFMLTLSIFNPDTITGVLSCAGMSGLMLGFVPMAAGVKGTMKDNGIDESDADFLARKGAAEDPALYFARYMKFLETKINENKDNPELKKELETLKTTITGFEGKAGMIDKLRAEVEKANLAIEGLKESGKPGARSVTLRDQVKEWHTKNAEAIKSLRAGHEAKLTPLTIKVAASPMTPANTYNGSAFLPTPEVQTGIIDLPRVMPKFWDVLPKGRSSSATYVWVNFTNPQGAAAFIGPGVAKPGISFELNTEVSNAKKIAASLKTATELLDDIDGMTTLIEKELRYAVMSKVNTTLMTGTLSSTVPAGIQTLSVPYSLTGVETDNANNWDAIIAAAAQLRSGYLDGPITAFVNPVDYANMILTKATTQGQLFVPAQTGVTIIEDYNIPVGFVQVALLDYYKVLIYEDFNISIGWENDDFTKNLVTFIGEMRIHQFMSENHTGAFIYDEFADIKAAIETP